MKINDMTDEQLLRALGAWQWPLQTAVNGIGPGSTKGARKLATERAMREFRNANRNAKQGK